MDREIMNDFHARRRALMLRAAAETGIYPAIVIVGAVIFALVVVGSSSFRIPPIRPALMRDAVMVAAVLIAGTPEVLRYVQRQQHQLRWLRYWGAVRARLEEGLPLSTALIPVNAPVEYVPRGALAHGIARGTDPEELLARLGCPHAMTELLSEAANEAELEQLLARYLKNATETHLRHLSVRLRLAQPAGILVAGSVVAWVVVRIVRPALHMHLERFTP